MARPQKINGVIQGTLGNFGILDSPISSWYSKSEPLTEAERAYAIRVIGKRWPYCPKELYKKILQASLALGLPIVRVVDSLIPWRNREGHKFYDGPPSHDKFTVRLRIALEKAILDSPGCTPEEVIAKMDWQRISICATKLYENYGFVFTQIRTREDGKEKGLDIRITQLPVVGIENLSHIEESIKGLELSRSHSHYYDSNLIGKPVPPHPLPLFKDLEVQQEAERKRLTPSEADPVVMQQSSAAREQPEPFKPEISQGLVDRIAEALRSEDESSRVLKEEVKKAISSSLATFDKATDDVNNLLLYYEKELSKILGALERATYPKNPPKA